ncbi:protealysin inhibitor emfourin [Streptomyces sp. NPDC101160]|uniref:protealysin inhibitor emfourin n=1 Tax=Streptomyces sp. NPDC101160 TaxID=3366118 RepID=UPI00380D1ACA
MRIRVVRTGGFAGIEKDAEVDTDGRPDDRRLRDLAQRTLTAPPPPQTRGVPDGFAYEITIDGQTVKCADPHLTDEQRELIQLVLKEGA